MVEFTDVFGRTIYVSPQQVVSVKAGFGGGTGASIEMPSGKSITVKSSVAEVLKKLVQGGWVR